MITLWGAGTTRTFRPIWMAEELGLTYELHPIGPRTGETQTAEFSALTRKQKVPFMIDGDVKLSESLTICRYLREAYQGNDVYLPQKLEERVKEDEWCNYIYGEIDETGLYVMRRHGDLSDIYGAAPDVVATTRDYVIKHLGVVAHYVENRDSILDGGFGVADIVLMSCLDWARFYGLDLPLGLTAYHKGIAERPAFQKAMTINYGTLAEAINGTT
ncbi:MAG: glutathione S-transferase family protein [Parvibaculales bacterium]